MELSHETKKIEWNKVHPTFQELKIRLCQCGIATTTNCYVQIERTNEFLTLNDDNLLDGPLIRV